MLELYYNFFRKFCDTKKFEELEMDSDSLYLALSEEILEDIILPEKRNEWEAIRSRDCTDSFTTNATGNVSPRRCCSAHKKHDKGEPGLLKKSSGVAKCCACVAKYIVATIERVTSTNSIARDSIKNNSGRLWDGPMSKYRKVLEEAVNVTSTNRGFRTMRHSVATYEQTKKGLFYFYPKRL